MPLIQIFVVLIVVGVLLWLVNRFLLMAGSIKSMWTGSAADTGSLFGQKRNGDLWLQ